MGATPVRVPCAAKWPDQVGHWGDSSDAPETSARCKTNKIRNVSGSRRRSAGMATSPCSNCSRLGIPPCVAIGDGRKSCRLCGAGHPGIGIRTRSSGPSSGPAAWMTTHVGSPCSWQSSGLGSRTSVSRSANGTATRRIAGRTSSAPSYARSEGSTSLSDPLGWCRGASTVRRTAFTTSTGWARSLRTGRGFPEISSLLTTGNSYSRSGISKKWPWPRSRVICPGDGSIRTALMFSSRRVSEDGSSLTTPVQPASVIPSLGNGDGGPSVQSAGVGGSVLAGAGAGSSGAGREC